MGGAGFNTTATSFLPKEMIDLAFSHENVSYARKAQVVWQKSEGDQTYVGVKWVAEGPTSERSKIRRLVRSLKAKGAATTRSQG
jgi:hypothetical protein